MGKRRHGCGTRHARGRNAPCLRCVRSYKAARCVENLPHKSNTFQFRRFYQKSAKIFWVLPHGRCSERGAGENKKVGTARCAVRDGMCPVAPEPARDDAPGTSQRDVPTCVLIAENAPRECPPFSGTAAVAQGPRRHVTATVERIQSIARLVELIRAVPRAPRQRFNLRPLFSG